MATYSSILAWRIPGTKEPGGLQSMGFKYSSCLSGTKGKIQEEVLSIGSDWQGWKKKENESVSLSVVSDSS